MRKRSRRRDDRRGRQLGSLPILYRVCGAAGVFLALSMWAAPARAREVTVPLRLDHAFIERLLLDTVYTGEGDTAEALRDARGCNQVLLSKPSVGSRAGRLVVRTQTKARLGAWMGRCVVLHTWDGTIEVHEEPRVDPGVPVIRFRVVDSNVEGATGGKGLTGNLWDLVKSGVHPRLEDLVVDLRGPLAELGVALPLFLSQEDVTRTRLLLKSLTFANPRVIDDGLAVDLRMDLSEIPPAPSVTAGPEPTLTAEELARWDASWQRWDAFMTFAILSLSREPHSDEQLAELRDIFLDARYDLARALREPPEGGADPVRRLFVRTWSRLRPLLRELSLGLPGEASLRYLSLIAATDALEAIDEVGPEMGVDISAEGLRRLARLLDPVGTADPLAYDTGVNPELRAMLGFGTPLPEPTPEPTTDAEATAEAEWTPELETTPHAEPTPEPTLEAEATAEAKWTPDFGTTSDAEPTAGAEATIETELTPEAEPTIETEPSPELEPATEPTAHAEPTAELPSTPEMDEANDPEPSPDADLPTEPTPASDELEWDPVFKPDPSPNADSGWLDWLVPRAAADETASAAALTKRLRGWAPTRADAAKYLPIALQVLELSREKVLAKRKLDKEYQEIFRAMVLATAWKESCWRQYVHVRGKVQTITSSAGALGVMQINQHVWRGVYDAKSLRDDFGYNAMAGTEILLHYLIDYAIKKGEHTATGNRDNLARATYAVYNGGPGHLKRYRTSKNKTLREIDASFWDKYRQIKKGNDLAVRQCYG